MKLLSDALSEKMKETEVETEWTRECFEIESKMTEYEIKQKDQEKKIISVCT